MSMKTNNKVKKSKRRGVAKSPGAEPELASGVGLGLEGYCDLLHCSTLDFSTPDSPEQTQNVHENKEQDQKVKESRS